MYAALAEVVLASLTVCVGSSSLSGNSGRAPVRLGCLWSASPHPSLWYGSNVLLVYTPGHTHTYFLNIPPISVPLTSFWQPIGSMILFPRFRLSSYVITACMARRIHCVWYAVHRQCVQRNALSIEAALLAVVCNLVLTL